MKIHVKNKMHALIQETYNCIITHAKSAMAEVSLPGTLLPAVLVMGGCSVNGSDRGRFSVLTLFPRLAPRHRSTKYLEPWESVILLQRNKVRAEDIALKLVHPGALTIGFLTPCYGGLDGRVFGIQYTIPYCAKLLWCK